MNPRHLQVFNLSTFFIFSTSVSSLSNKNKEKENWNYFWVFKQFAPKFVLIILLAPDSRAAVTKCFLKLKRMRERAYHQQTDHIYLLLYFMCNFCRSFYFKELIQELFQSLWPKTNCMPSSTIKNAIQSTFMKITSGSFQFERDHIVLSNFPSRILVYFSNGRRVDLC